MQIRNIQSNYNNIYLNKNNKSPQFKGTVSPEFIQYVEDKSNT